MWIKRNFHEVYVWQINLYENFQLNELQTTALLA